MSAASSSPTNVWPMTSWRPGTAELVERSAVSSSSSTVEETRVSMPGTILSRL